MDEIKTKIVVAIKKIVPSTNNNNTDELHNTKRTKIAPSIRTIVAT